MYIHSFNNLPNPMLYSLWRANGHSADHFTNYIYIHTHTHTHTHTYVCVCVRIHLSATGDSMYTR